MERGLNIQCVDDEAETSLSNILDNYLRTTYDSGKQTAFTYFLSRTEIYAGSVTTKALVSFLGIYLGFVFMIVSAAILAKRQKYSDAMTERGKQSGRLIVILDQYRK